MMDAGSIRRLMRERRSMLDMRAQARDAEAVCAQIKRLSAYQDARCVMAYIACRGELSLEWMILDVLSSGRTLVLPRCEEQGVMTARRVTDMNQLVSGAYGLMEPDAACAIVHPQQINLILAPGVAFDRLGHRIGQGGGYYDRYLPGTQAAVIGVCHDFALLQEIPFEAHDYRMHAVITPSGVTCCSAECQRWEETR